MVVPNEAGAPLKIHDVEVPLLVYEAAVRSSGVPPPIVNVDQPELGALPITVKSIHAIALK
jgi:hypothetical protein